MSVHNANSMVQELLEMSQRMRADGMTLLLVILVMSGLMTVSIGIFNVSFAELRISGELTSSFRAFYAADRIFEYALKLDRDNQSGPLCTNDSPNPDTPCYTICTEDMPNCPAESATVDIIDPFITQVGSQWISVGCGRVTLTKIAGITTVRATGQFDCSPNSMRVVRRAFEVSY